MTASAGEADALAATARLIERALVHRAASRWPRLIITGRARRQHRLLATGLRSARRGLKGRTYSVEELDAAYLIAAELLPPGIDAWNTI